MVYNPKLKYRKKKGGKYYTYSEMKKMPYRKTKGKVFDLRTKGWTEVIPIKRKG